MRPVCHDAVKTCTAIGSAVFYFKKLKQFYDICPLIARGNPEKFSYFLLLTFYSNCQQYSLQEFLRAGALKPF